MGTTQADRRCSPKSDSAAPASEVRLAAGHSAADTASATPANVLLVDDDSLCRRAVAHMLTGCGCQVTQATGGAAALQAIAREPFDVVISDFSMPGMDGFELLQRVRSAHPHLSFILFSGDTSLEVATHAAALGATRYLLKPLQLEQLLSAVEHSAALTRQHSGRVHAKSLSLPPPSQCDRLLSEPSRSLSRAMRSVWLAHQPIAFATTHSLCGYALLTRVGSARNLSSLDLFKLARHCNQLNVLGRFLRQMAATATARLSSDHLVFINLHPSELADEALLYEHSPLAAFASRIVLELADRRRLDEIPELLSRIQTLRSMGYRLAINDVGVGYSGLNAIALFEPEFVKIDRSLVSKIDTTPIHRRVVAGVVQLGQDLGTTVICEGVETESEREALVGLGVQLLQGTLIGNPEREPAVPEPRGLRTR